MSRECGSSIEASQALSKILSACRVGSCEILAIQMVLNNADKVKCKDWEKRMPITRHDFCRCDSWNRRTKDVDIRLFTSILLKLHLSDEKSKFTEFLRFVEMNVFNSLHAWAMPLAIGSQTLLQGESLRIARQRSHDSDSVPDLIEALPVSCHENSASCLLSSALWILPPLLLTWWLQVQLPAYQLCFKEREHLDPWRRQYVTTLGLFCLFDTMLCSSYWGQDLEDKAVSQAMFRTHSMKSAEVLWV